MPADLTNQPVPSEGPADQAQEGCKPPSLMSFVADKPKIALSILIGAVALCGLSNAVFFFNTFNIPYRLYLGATDFVTVAVRSSPSVVLALGISILVALAVALMVWVVVEVALWLLPKLLFSYRRAVPRPLAVAEMRLGHATAAHIMRLAGRADASCADRATRIEKAVAAMRMHPALVRRLRARFGARRARELRRDFRARLKNALALATCLEFADRNYRELFVAATLAVALMGALTSQLAATRIQGRLEELPRMNEVSPNSTCPVLDTANGAAHEFMGGAVRKWAMAVFDHFYVDTYLQCASVNLAGVDESVDDLVLLGSTTSHTFFYSVKKRSPFVVPTEAIETLSQSRMLPEILKKAAPANERANAGPLLARLDDLADEVGAFRRLLETTIPRPQPINLLAADSARATAQQQCVEVPGAEFRFAHGLARLHREHLEDNRRALRALVRYFAIESVDVRPGDYVLLVGHADVSGDVNFNQRLSERRAEHVLEILREAEVGRVFDAAYAIGAGEGARAFEEDPSGSANRRVLVYHCRSSSAATPTAENGNAPAHTIRFNGSAAATSSIEAMPTHAIDPPNRASENVDGRPGLSSG